MGKKSIKKYKCPFCELRLSREDLLIHVGDEHDELIPEDFSVTRYVFNYVNKRPMEYHGKCTECGKSTPFDDHKARYNRQCGSKNCHESYLRKFEKNMMRVNGVTRISTTAEGQEKMLANRKISGTYRFKNRLGIERDKTYTGSYELKALEFMDQMLNIAADDIMCPGPVMEYMYEGKKHFYIPDFLYVPYNLIIEVKDGGKRPNNRSMPEYRAKQIAKEKHIVENTNYNYLRLTDNNLAQLLNVFMDLKMQLTDDTGKRVIHVNETMNALMTGYIPGMRDTGSVYIVNYLKNNVFSGEPEEGYGVARDSRLKQIITRNKEGKLALAPENFLDDAYYNLFITEMSIEEFSEKVAPYMGEFVEEGFLYETVFGKKMYSYDQIQTEAAASAVIDYNKSLEVLGNITESYLKGKDRFGDIVLEGVDIGFGSDNDGLTIKRAPLASKYMIESKHDPELFVEADEPDINSIEARILEGLSYREEDCK